MLFLLWKPSKWLNLLFNIIKLILPVHSTTSAIMLLSSVNYTSELLSKHVVNEICDSLQNEQLRMVSLRQCKVSDVGFKRIMKYCGSSKHILQLTLNLGICTDQNRVELLAQALRRNKTLKGLFLHGNPIGDDGLKVIAEALRTSYSISTLDIGDCDLGDASIQHLKALLSPEDDRPGLTELTLSGNTKITQHGWAILAMCISCSESLRSLYVDYNKLGDSGASCLLIAAAASQMIEVLDLEGTELTEKTGKLVMELVQTYPGSLKKLSLVGNKVRKSTMAVIKSILKANMNSDDMQDSTEDDMSTTEITSETSTIVESSSDSGTGSTLETSNTDGSTCTESNSNSSSTVKHNSVPSQKGNEVDEATVKKLEAESLDDYDEMKEIPVFW